MKVLMVHKTYRGGVAIHVKEVSRELKKKGIKVKEITRNEDLKYRSFYTSYWRMRKLFRKWSYKFDVIHCHDWSIAYPGVRERIKNMIATFHGLPTNFLAKYFEDYCIKRLRDRAIVISPKMKRVYREATYIPNGVNLKFFKPVKSVEREELLVGLAQKYNKRKILHMVDELNLKCITTEGKLPFIKLPEFYSRIQIFISIPYKQAGFNMVWLEAMACEVPYIIGTNIGIGELLPIYKVKNFEELKETLEKIKHGKFKPLRNTRKWILKHNLTWENSVNNLIKKIYERLIL